MRSCVRIVLLVMLCGLTAANSLSQIQSDQFNGGSLSSFWRFINPLNDALLDFTGSQARITLPPGLSHDPQQFGENKAPRLVQQIATPGNDYGNFEIFAKFDATLSSQYQMVGLQAIQDQYNYVRAELFTDGTNIYPLLWAFDNIGTPNPMSPVIGSALPSGTTPPYYVRLKRQDSVFTLFYSTHPDSGWTTGGTLNHTMLVDSVGVYTTNSDGTSPGTTAPAFQGLIDYFTASDPLPVQLASFTASHIGNNRVRLNWMTITETNNFGFYIQKSAGNTSAFRTIEGSFIAGQGTTITPHSYTFTDVTTSGTWFYRLQQVDLDGSAHYSDPVRVDVVTSAQEEKTLPGKFGLEQNYPNPFNPSTTIVYDVARATHVLLEVYNLIGQKVATLVDGRKEAGRYTMQFDAGNLTSGVYLYKLRAGGESHLKKMILAR